MSLAKDDYLKLLEKNFGSRTVFLGQQLFMLSSVGQLCDVTFYSRKPIINVTVGEKYALAMMYGAGPQKVREMLQDIHFSDGTRVSLNEIWTINPMPKKTFLKEELDAVDLAEGDECVGPNGESLRKMISDTYHCESSDEVDFYLRRFLAS